MSGMKRKHDVDRANGPDHPHARRERDAQVRLLDKGADQIAPRPWQEPQALPLSKKSGVAKRAQSRPRPTYQK